MFTSQTFNITLFHLDTYILEKFFPTQNSVI